MYDDNQSDLVDVPEKKYIPIDDAPTLKDAQALAPWAAEIVEVDGGWIAFLRSDDAARHLNQA